MNAKTLELAKRYSQDTDGTVYHDLFEANADLWESNPELAARLAFSEVQEHWEAQHVSGVTNGVPVIQDNHDSDDETAATRAA
jgi:hypothetical protein